MNLFILISAFLYATLILFALIGLRRLKAKSKQVNTASSKLLVSVIVPFRNEADNLQTLIGDLRQQTYPHFEVHLVDDHSEDQSAETVAALIKDAPNFHQYSLQKESGKKAALSMGIDGASGQFIVTADADVSVPEGWLSTIVNSGLQSDADLLILPLCVSSQKSGALHFFQMAENNAIQALGFGMAAWGWPISCNGANLAFRKSAFESCGGYSAHQQVASGDDVLLMQEMLQNGFRVVPVLSRQVIATTSTLAHWKNAFSQRIRWAGKTGKMNNGAAVVSGLFLLLNAAVLMTALLIPATGWAIWLGALLLKVLLDVLLIKTIEKSFGQRLNPLKLALIAAVYIFYLPIMTVLSAIWKPTWKGRKI